jgi:hypothetical protein
LRRICFREIDAITAGGAPKNWHRGESPSHLPQPGQVAVR